MMRSVGCIGVTGVSRESIPITHVGTSDRIGQVHIVPGASANLLSIPVLMRGGCSLGTKGDRLWVKSPKGEMKLTARLNDKGMYVVKLRDIGKTEDAYRESRK